MECDRLGTHASLISGVSEYPLVLSTLAFKKSNRSEQFGQDHLASGKEPGNYLEASTVVVPSLLILPESCGLSLLSFCPSPQAKAFHPTNLPLVH